MTLAHVFGGNGGPGAGFIHPLTGSDHLLAMFTVGLLSAAIGGRAIWTLPTAFVLAMICGGIAGIMHVPVPGVEYGVALSVVLLGVLLAVGPTLDVRYAWLVTAVFGSVHGHAHGVEMPRVASPILYVVGFVAATAGLHMLGVFSGLLIQCRAGGTGRLRASGLAIGTAGLILLARLT